MVIMMMTMTSSVQVRVERRRFVHLNGNAITMSINHLCVKASKMTVTEVSVQDQQGSESAYSDPKTKPKYAEEYTKYKQWEVTIRNL